MKKSAFARLCSVGPSMVTKWIKDGMIVLRGSAVDERASLMRLEGHLDEQKRRAALLRLAGIEPGGLGRLENPSVHEHVSDGVNGVHPDPARPALTVIEGGAGDQPPTSWRAEREKAEAQLKQIELLERQGLLLDRQEVAEAVQDAVVTFWTEVERRHREEAFEIAAEAHLSADQAAAVRAWLRRRDDALRNSYAAALLERAGAAAQQGEDAI